jgi:hypothetical protein
VNTGPIDYAAVLADLEARKTQIGTAILAIKTILSESSAKAKSERPELESIPWQKRHFRV